MVEYEFSAPITSLPSEKLFLTTSVDESNFCESPGVQWKGSDIFRAKYLGIDTLEKVTRTILLCLHHPSLKLYSIAPRETLSAWNSSHRESESLGSSWIPQLCGTQPKRFILYLNPLGSLRGSACLKSGTARFRENVQGSQKPNLQ